MIALDQCSPAGAIGYRPNDRARLWPLLLLSVVLHAALALLVASVLARHFQEKKDDVLDLGIDVTLGEAVQEAITTQPSVEPPAVTPPPTIPEPLPPPPDPPPKEMPEIIETKVAPPPVVKATPRPVAPPAPKREKTKPPTATKFGPEPRVGAVGGNVTQGATTGTPGGQKIGNQGWRTPKPPYPRAALIAHIQGEGEVRITTDAAGNVKEAVITRSISPVLDANTRGFARGNWKGPPNATRTVQVIYRIP